MAGFTRVPTVNVFMVRYYKSTVSALDGILSVLYSIVNIRNMFSQTIVNKKSSSRIILDYKKNPELRRVLRYLENYFVGLSKAEITKLALVELFQNKNRNIPVKKLTEEEERSLHESMMDESENIVVPADQKFSDFIEKFSQT